MMPLGEFVIDEKEMGYGGECVPKGKSDGHLIAAVR